MCPCPLYMLTCYNNYTPPPTPLKEDEWEVNWFHLVYPSTRRSVRPSVYRIKSAPYLPQYWSDPFHIYTSYQPTLDGVSHVEFHFLNSKLWIFAKLFTSYLCTSCSDLWMSRHILGMVGPINMEQKGCELIYQIHYMILTFDPHPWP